MACLIHKREGCKCLKCGKELHEWHSNNYGEYIENRDNYDIRSRNKECKHCKQVKENKLSDSNNKCLKCGLSMEDALRASIEQNNRIKSLGLRIFASTPQNSFFKCLKCKKIVCIRCTLELPGHTEKSCPFCKKNYGLESIFTVINKDKKFH